MEGISEACRYSLELEGHYLPAQTYRNGNNYELDLRKLNYVFKAFSLKRLELQVNGDKLIIFMNPNHPELHVRWKKIIPPHKKIF